MDCASRVTWRLGGGASVVMVGGLMSTRRASSTRWWWWVIDLPPSGRFGKHGDRGGRPGFVEGDEDVVQDDGNGGESPVDALGLELVDSGEPQREVELVGGGSDSSSSACSSSVGADDDQ